MPTTGSILILKVIGWMCLLVGTLAAIFFIVSAIRLMQQTTDVLQPPISALGSTASFTVSVLSMLFGALFWAVCLVLATIAESALHQAHLSAKYLPRIVHLLKQMEFAQPVYEDEEA